MAKLIARAVSVLPFQAMTILLPMRDGGDGGAMINGRPDSNSTVSSSSRRGAWSPFPGRASTDTSNSRAIRPIARSPGSIRSIQLAAGDGAGAALQRHAGRSHDPDEARMDVFGPRPVLLVEILERDRRDRPDPPGADDNAAEIRSGRHAGDMSAGSARQENCGFELCLQLRGAL